MLTPTPMTQGGNFSLIISDFVIEISGACVLGCYQVYIMAQPTTVQL